MDRKLDSIFEFNGTTLKVVKGNLCYGCYFYNSGRCDKPTSIGSCIESTRTDKESVIYKEIKNNMEERNIKLSLEKAREFYSKGGEFKDLALSAFTEDEILISKLPKTWEEFCNNCDARYNKDSYINFYSNIISRQFFIKRLRYDDRNLLPSREIAEQHLALMQLHQLRDCYRQGWIPDWNNSIQKKYVIYNLEGKFTISPYYCHSHFLAFQNEKRAEDFLNNFRDLIVKAGDLI